MPPLQASCSHFSPCKRSKQFKRDPGRQISVERLLRIPFYLKGMSEGSASSPVQPGVPTQPDTAPAASSTAFGVHGFTAAASAAPVPHPVAQSALQHVFPSFGSASFGVPAPTAASASGAVNPFVSSFDPFAVSFQTSPGFGSSNPFVLNSATAAGLNFGSIFQHPVAAAPAISPASGWPSPLFGSSVASAPAASGRPGTPNPWGTDRATVQDNADDYPDWLRESTLHEAAQNVRDIESGAGFGWDCAVGRAADACASGLRRPGPARFLVFAPFSRPFPISSHPDPSLVALRSSDKYSPRTYG